MGSSPGAGGRGLGKNECDAMNKTILSRTIFRWRWQRTPNYSTATAVNGAGRVGRGEGQKHHGEAQQESSSLLAVALQEAQTRMARGPIALRPERVPGVVPRGIHSPEAGGLVEGQLPGPGRDVRGRRSH